ncbi:hypothetical protein [Streptomyces sp. NPDC006459]|uniref:hypothetical protein n=1 Tax=Streptomyces sp. NPDC006459 TaxID=3154303 RepID=UPI0033B17FD3
MALRSRLATGSLIAVLGTVAAGVPAATTGPAAAATRAVPAAPASPAAPAILAAPAAPEAPVTAATVDLAGWMGGLRAVLGDRPLNRIVMPGSHDSGSWSITRDSGVCSHGDQAGLANRFPSIAASLSRTQSGTIVDQLNAGARYFDLRLCKQGGRWFTYHGGPMGSQFFDAPDGRGGVVRGEVNGIAEWIRSHPQEVVIIRLSTAAAPDTARADNSEAVSALAAAIGGGAGHPYLADGSLSPTSTYDRFLAAGKRVVLIDDMATTGRPWAWGPGSQTYRGSYVQADTAWTDYVKALFDPHTLRKNFDAVLRRGDQVLDRAPAPADTGKFFVLQEIIDPSLSIPDLVLAQALEKIGAVPSSVADQYLLHLEHQLNPLVLAKLKGDWGTSNIAENMNIVMTDDVNQDGSGLRAGELQRGIIAQNTPPTTARTFYGAEIGADGSWTAPTPLAGYGGSFRFAGARESVAALPDGSTQILGRGLDGNLYHNVQSRGGAWQGWAPMAGVGGAAAFSGPEFAITGLPDGSAQVMAVGNDGHAYHNIRRADGSWQGWSSVAGDGGSGLLRIAEVSAAGMPDGSARFLVFGDDGRMRLGTRRADGSWTAWTVVAGVGAPDFRGSAPAIAALPGGDSQIAAIGLDGNVWHTVLRADGTRQGWSGPPGVSTARMGAGAIALTGLPDGNSRLLAVGLDGNVWHTLRDGQGAWAPWRPVPGPKGAGSFPGDRVALAGRPDGSTRLLVTTR